MNRDFNDEIKIDRYNLDQEFIEQPERYCYWAEQSAIANRDVELKALEKKIIKAQLYAKYREQLEQSNEKITDTRIDAMVRASPIYEMASKALINAKEDAEILEGAKWAFASRKNSLEQLANGIVNGLFSDPRTIKQIQTSEKLREDIRIRRNK